MNHHVEKLLKCNQHCTGRHRSRAYCHVQCENYADLDGQCEIYQKPHGKYQDLKHNEREAFSFSMFRHQNNKAYSSVLSSNSQLHGPDKRTRQRLSMICEYSLIECLTLDRFKFAVHYKISIIPTRLNIIIGTTLCPKSFLINISNHSQKPTI